MDAIFNVINEYVFSYVMRFIMLLTSQNFALTIFLFTLIINLALIPLSIKSQKSSVQQTLIKPKLHGELKAINSEIKGIVNIIPAIFGASGLIFFCITIEIMLERIAAANERIGIIQFHCAFERFSVKCGISVRLIPKKLKSIGLIASLIIATFPAMASGATKPGAEIWEIRVNSERISGVS